MFFAEEKVCKLQKDISTHATQNKQSILRIYKDLILLFSFVEKDFWVFCYAIDTSDLNFDKISKKFDVGKIKGRGN